MSLILPGGKDIKTEANDTWEIGSDSAGNWRVRGINKYSGLPLVCPSISPQGRITLTSGVAVTVSDVANATTLYYTPASGNYFQVWNGSGDDTLSFSELSLTLDATSGHTNYHQSGKNFDCFVFNNSGADIGTGPSWSSDTARGTGAGTTEIEFFNGLWRNKNIITLRTGSASGDTISIPARQATYVCTIRTTADGQTSDTRLKRFVWNAYNQATRPLYVDETGPANWFWSTAQYRQVNANTANKVEYVCGLDGGIVNATASSVAINSTSSVRIAGVGLGVDSVTTNSGKIGGLLILLNGVSIQGQIAYKGSPGIGYHYLAWLEFGSGADTQTWAKSATPYNTGLSAEVLG